MSSIEKVSCLGSCLTAVIPHHSIPLAPPRPLTHHQETLTNPAIAAHQLPELIISHVDRKSGNTEPRVTRAHHHAHLLVLDKHRRPLHWPGVQYLRVGQGQLGSRFDSPISLVNGDCLDINIWQRYTDILKNIEVQFKCSNIILREWSKFISPSFNA